MALLNMSEIKSAASEFGNKYGAERIFLFGSYARGDATSESDVDFRVDNGKIRTLVSLAGLQLDLEQKLGKKVDLLTTDSLDRNFLDSIRSEEVLLYGTI